MKYTVVIEKTNNGYSAYAPDVPGCIAAADTRAEVEELMREAITYHLEMLRDYGDPIPEPQLSVEEAMNFHSDSLAADDETVSQEDKVVGTVEVEVELTQAAMAS